MRRYTEPTFSPSLLSPPSIGGSCRTARHLSSPLALPSEQRIPARRDECSHRSGNWECEERIRESTRPGGRTQDPTYRLRGGPECPPHIRHPAADAVVRRPSCAAPCSRIR